MFSALGQLDCVPAPAELAQDKLAHATGEPSSLALLKAARAEHFCSTQCARLLDGGGQDSAITKAGHNIWLSGMAELKQPEFE